MFVNSICKNFQIKTIKPEKEHVMQFHTLVFKPLRLGVLILSLFSFMSPVQASEDGDVSEGQKIAQKLCARCHAIGQHGQSPHKDAPRFSEIVSKWPVDSLAESLAEGIVVGHKAMPEFQLDPDPLGHLLAYLSSLTNTNPTEKKEP